MGCICSKGTSSATDYVESEKEKELSKSTKPLVTSSNVEENIVEVDGSSVNEAITKPPPLENVSSAPIVLDEVEQPRTSSVRNSISKNQHQRRATVDIGANGGQERTISRIVTMPRAVEGEQGAAGWPTWLTSVAGDAIKGWVPRKAESFEKLDKIGQGTYSNVYRARDLETGKIVALKKVRFVNLDPESVRFMAREIYILRKLDHPNVIKLEGLVTSRMSCSLYLVFEYMEHDLAGLAASRSIKFTESQIKCYMQQLLRGLEHCHSRGVLHRDIKGSNLLIDNNGALRIADFGLATFFNPNEKQQLTSRVVTLWYRPPELLLGATEYGVAVDMWSSGCILAELLAQKPIMPGRTEVEQMHKIFKLCGSPSEEYWKKSKLPHATIFKPQHPYKRCLAETYKDFPPSALALLDSLLAMEPESRGTATDALNSDFFTTKPLPCDPSSLPKYPPSKEFDAKMRDEEARRQKEAALNGVGSESGRRHLRNSAAVPAKDVNADQQKRQHCTSEKYNPHEDGGSGFPIDPPRANEPLPLWNKKLEGSRSTTNGHELKAQKSNMHQGAGESSILSSRSSAQLDMLRERREKPKSTGFNQLDVSEPSENQEWTHHLLDRPVSSDKKPEKVFVPKKSRIHYSGPLLPPGGNLEDMLKEHERQIQQAVRKARLEKVKTKKDMGDSIQSQSLLHSGKNGW